MRYPKRTRVKPVQYWQNQKVSYKGGRVVGIERTQTFDIKELLNTNKNFESIINVNFFNHDIEIEVIIPGKKSLESQGIKDIYENLEMRISEKSHSGTHEVYFEDGLRSEQLEIDSTIKVEPFAYFQLSNKTKTPIVIQMRLKAKIN